MKTASSIFTVFASYLAKIPFIGSVAALQSLALALAGAFIAHQGAYRLWEHWLDAAPYLPFSLPPDVADKIQWAGPLILTTFVSAVSSLAGCLIGVMWVCTGLGDALATLGKQADVGPTADPGLAADRLAWGSAANWAAPSRSLGFLRRIVPPLGRLTPARFAVVKGMTESWWKLIFVGLAIALIAYLFQMAPTMVNTHLRKDFTLVVPSMSPLYFLIGFTFVLEAAMAVSLVPFFGRQAETSFERFRVRGYGDPSLMLALVEEGSRLLTAGRMSVPLPVRLEHSEGAPALGTFIESAPSRVKTLGRPAAYLCAPIAFFLLTNGFSRLIHFNWPSEPIYYAEFISRHFLDRLLSIAVAIGLIYCGLRFAATGRLLAAMGRFKSIAVFCRTDCVDEPASVPPDPSQNKPGDWRVARGAPASFVEWAKNPKQTALFDVSVHWAEFTTESSGPGEPRSPAGATRSDELDQAVHRILELPALVAFRYEAVPSPQPPASSVEAVKSQHA